MNLRHILLCLFSVLISYQDLVTKPDGCYLRCIAQCVAFVSKDDNPNDNHQSVESCQPQCQKMKDQVVCSENSCWSTCNGNLEPERILPAPTNLTAAGARGLSWGSVPGAVLYYVGYKSSNKKSFTHGDFFVTVRNTADLSLVENIDPCSEIDVVVAAFSEDGIGNESKEVKIGRPSPTADPKLQLIGMQYFNTSLISDFYRANATVFVEFRYRTDPWFLGQNDLVVQPLFHLISCVDPDLSQGIPVPDFTAHVGNSTISTSIGSDMMDRKCRYVYYLQSVSSKKCGTITEMPSPPSEALQTVLVECDIVKNAPCFKVPIYPHPQCGQVDNVKVSVLSQDSASLTDPSSSLTINVTFIPATWGEDVPTLYYVGIYGEAEEYKTKEEEAFLGVNITRVLGEKSSCQVFSNSSGNCMKENMNRSIVISGLHAERLYGLTICGVKDVRNVTLPDLSATTKSSKPKAVKIRLLEHQLCISHMVPYQILIHAPDHFRINDSHNNRTLNTHESEHFIEIPSPRAASYNSKITASTLLATSNINKTMKTEKENMNHTSIKLCGTIENPSTPEEIEECWKNTTYLPILTSVPTTRSSNPIGWIIGVVIGVIAVLVAVLFSCRCYYRNDRIKKLNKYKLEIQMEKESRNRYTDFPVVSKNDIWEIERRNLIIYGDKKLGSGAFGAVYLGKLIGKSLAHRDANSPLGINLMRAENCEVAVKMLPEYADEMCKQEFLREIALMKTLGYHERLVNMLACVTESEPLCLVVEYCDNGDLLHYLRERCKYMMKLDDLSISYHDPPVNENYDPTMIITLKQLLQFAVQISYGLEFLSQKGFIHRDVAARNVLVHEGASCKIGDFGLCRYIYADQSQYKSKGGKLPLKWMSPEAIRHYEFSVKSDVWSFGVLLFEIITLGGSPYPGMPPEDVLPFLEFGGRIEKPDNCPENFYEVMRKCWCSDPSERIEFSEIRMQLATQLEDITEDYSYLKLDAAKDYYNVQYGDEKRKTISMTSDGMMGNSVGTSDNLSYEKELSSVAIDT